jgi:N-methylhydantoinase A/oxoprolinase/acetone carboxylase beta subunit
MEPHGSRRVNFYATGLEAEEVPIYRTEAPRPGSRARGPAIVELPDTTIVVPHRATLEVDARGSVVIDLKGMPEDA